MSTEKNKALIRRFFDAMMNQGDMAVADELFAADHVHHFPDGDINGPDGVKQMVTGLRSAFPDFTISADEVIAEGDKVVVLFTIRGTHQGEGIGISPTGKHVTYTGIDIFRIAGDKIVERRGEVDMLGLLQQLDAIPSPG